MSDDANVDLLGIAGLEEALAAIPDEGIRRVISLIVRDARSDADHVHSALMWYLLGLNHGMDCDIRTAECEEIGDDVSWMDKVKAAAEIVRNAWVLVVSR